MNILILTTHFNHGGITSYIVNLVKGLKKRGHKVFVASSGGSCLGRLKDLSVGHINIPICTKSELSPKIIISFLKLIYFLRENDIEIIHSQTRVTQVLGQLLSFFSETGFVSTCHGFFKPRMSRKIFPCRGRFVIAISESVREHLIKDLKVRDNEIRLIHHGIDLDRFRRQKTQDRRRQIKNRVGLGDGPVIGIIARLSEVKGHKYLILAFKDVLKEFPDAKLLMAGEGRLKKELEDLVSNFGIQKNVIFMLSIDDADEVLSIMDVFVMPSLQEGLGLSIMEAQAVGVPTVAFDVGGINSLIKNQETGILVNYLDTDSLARAIVRILKDKELTNKIIQNARVFIQENFSLDKMVEETEVVYEKAKN